MSQHNADGFPLVTASATLEGVYDFQKALGELGIPIEVDDTFLASKTSKFPSNSIGLGCSIIPSIAAPILVEAMNFWPSVRRVWLSSDRYEDAPDDVHDRISIGTWIEDKRLPRFKEWTEEHIRMLDPNMSLMHFHGLVRSLSALNAGPTAQ
jgi:hypothetical protein